VGLTAKDEMSLRNASLITFYDKNIPAFKKHAARSYAFAYDNLLGTGLQLRPDDVAVSLVQSLEINADLQSALAQKKLSQKFWYQRFADLIVDRLWEELKSEHQQGQGN